MKTHPIYLEDSYKKEMDAHVLAIVPEGGKRFRVILDETVFYPMGGGQPTDQGILRADGFTASVYQVLMKDGEIWHFIEADTPPQDGMFLHGEINWERRFMNMRVHSAGHIVDFAIYLLGYSPSPLLPTKGDHGKKPNIVYTGVLGKDIAKEVEIKANELVSQDKLFQTAFVPLVDLEKDAIYLQPGLPTNKPLRKLTLEGVGSVADGGTQVARTKEVGRILILSIVETATETIVSYRLE